MPDARTDQLSQGGRHVVVDRSADTGNHRLVGNLQILQAQRRAVRMLHVPRHAFEMQAHQAGQRVRRAYMRRREDVACLERLGPGEDGVDVQLARTAQEGADQRADRRTDQVVRCLLLGAQPRGRADVDIAGATAAAKDRDQRLVADLGIEFGFGKVVLMPAQKLPARGHQRRIQLAQRVDGTTKPLFGDRLAAQRLVQRLQHPLAQWRDQVLCDDDIGAARCAVDAARREHVQPREAQQVAQLLVLLRHQEHLLDQHGANQRHFHALEGQQLLVGRRGHGS